MERPYQARSGAGSHLLGTFCGYILTCALRDNRSCLVQGEPGRGGRCRQEETWTRASVLLALGAPRMRAPLLDAEEARGGRHESGRTRGVELRREFRASRTGTRASLAVLRHLVAEPPHRARASARSGGPSAGRRRFAEVQGRPRGSRAEALSEGARLDHVGGSRLALLVSESLRRPPRLGAEPARQGPQRRRVRARAGSARGREAPRHLPRLTGKTAFVPGRGPVCCRATFGSAERGGEPSHDPGASERDSTPPPRVHGA